MHLEENGYHKNILIGNGTKLGEKLWCYCSNSNDIYCIAIQEACVTKKIIFDGIPEEKQHPFGTVLTVAECLYFVPYFGKDMVRYYIDSGETEYIDLGYLYTEAGNRGMFIAGGCYKHFLFLFPFDYHNIARFDTNNKQIDLLQVPESNEKRLPFIRRCIVKENNIWIAEDGGNRILRVDAEKMQSRWFPLQEDIRIRDLCIWGEKIYCLDAAGKIITFDTKSGSGIIFADIKSEQFGFIEKSTNYIWLIPNKTNRIIRYSKKRGVEEIDYPDNFVFDSLFLTGKVRTFSSLYSNETEAIVMPRCNNTLIKIDKVEEKIEFIDITYSKSLRQEIKDGFFTKLSKSSPVPESEGNMEWFLEFIREGEKSAAISGSGEEIGKIIYREVMDK